MPNLDLLLTTEVTTMSNTPVPIEQSRSTEKPVNKYNLPRKRTNNCKVERKWVVECHNYHKTR